MTNGSAGSRARVDGGVTPGQRVRWQYTQRGGWNLTTLVCATVLKVTAKKVTIEVYRRNRDIGTYWTPVRKSVSPDSLDTSDCAWVRDGVLRG